MSQHPDFDVGDLEPEEALLVKLIHDNLEKGEAEIQRILRAYHNANDFEPTSTYAESSERRSPGWINSEPFTQQIRRTR